MGLLLVLFAFPGLWGFAWLFVLVVPVCGLIDCRLSGVFLYRADALFLCFRGGAVRFSSFWGLFDFVCILCWVLPLWK